MLELFLKGGWVMYPILACSLVSWAIIVERGVHFFRTLGKGGRARLELVSRAHARAKASGLDADAREKAVLHASGPLLAADNRGLAVLGAVATLSPLCGLFGTVLGMIELFRSLELSGAQPQFADLVGGVWTALLCTAFGLFAALPAYASNYLFDYWATVRAETLRQHFLELESQP